MGLNYDNPYVASLLGSLGDEVSKALNEAIVRVKSGNANAAITRWFGDTSPATVTYITTALSRMRSIMNCRTINVSFTSIQKIQIKDAGGNVTGTAIERDSSNAFGQRFTKQNMNDMLPINGNLPSYAGAGFTESNLWLAEDFTKLDKYLPLVGGRIDSSGWFQSKFNTLVHEMSHNILGTFDCEGAGGWVAYGTKRAEELATKGLAYGPAAGYAPPFAALYNAENWGIFVEATGRNRGE